MSNFTPMMRDRFAWKLNKQWLSRVPCFSLVMEQCTPGRMEEMSGFLVQIAVSMQPYIFAPGERPPARRLYICTDGRAKYRGLDVLPGDSWGAVDVLLHGKIESKRHRAIASSYLHVLWMGYDDIKRISEKFPAAYRLTKLWACINAAGEYLIEEYRTHKREMHGWTLKIGTKPGCIAPSILERALNRGAITAERLLEASGVPVRDASGRETYKLRFTFAALLDVVIYKEIEEERNKLVFRVRPGVPPRASTITRGSSADDDLELFDDGKHDDEGAPDANGKPPPLRKASLGTLKNVVQTADTKHISRDGRTSFSLLSA